MFMGQNRMISIVRLTNEIKMRYNCTTCLKYLFRGQGYVSALVLIQVTTSEYVMYFWRDFHIEFEMISINSPFTFLNVPLP